MVSYFTDEETKAHRGQETHPQSHLGGDRAGISPRWCDPASPCSGNITGNVQRVGTVREDAQGPPGILQWVFQWVINVSKCLEAGICRLIRDQQRTQPAKDGRTRTML